jgi:hypothetical protein
MCRVYWRFISFKMSSDQHTGSLKKIVAFGSLGPWLLIMQTIHRSDLGMWADHVWGHVGNLWGQKLIRLKNTRWDMLRVPYP